jgi:hypothetical protein
LIGQITRLLAAQDAIDVGGGAAIEFDAIHAVERQASVREGEALRIDRG